VSDGSTATAPLERGGSAGEVVRRLVRVVGPGPRSASPVTVDLPPDRLVLGRDPDDRDGLALPDETASRRHAEIVHLSDYDCFRVRDLGSKNGTFVDGRPVEEAVLEADSVLRIGQHIFVLDQVTLPARFALDPPPEVSLARAWAELQIDRAAASDLPVVVQGPTGAGKERLAERLHERSARRGPLVPVNCATLNRELLGSELFGHVKGAFSDARSDRSGLIASADGGTLFLDEIAELPLEQQPALLRVLQEKRLRPVGSDRELDVDVRVVAATHRDLEAASEAGAFRADLYGRLAGLVVALPGLAHRRVEILPLLHASAPQLKLGLEAAEALLLHDWPRNVRELQALAHRFELFGEGTVELGLLPEPMRQARSPASRPSGSAPRRPSHGEKPTAEALERLLREHRGRVADVARQLGLTRQSTYRLLSEHGLSAAAFRRKAGET